MFHVFSYVHIYVIKMKYLVFIDILVNKLKHIFNMIGIDLNKRGSLEHFSRNCRELRELP